MLTKTKRKKNVKFEKWKFWEKKKKMVWRYVDSELPTKFNLGRLSNFREAWVYGQQTDDDVESQAEPKKTIRVVKEENVYITHGYMHN